MIAGKKRVRRLVSACAVAVSTLIGARESGAQRMSMPPSSGADTTPVYDFTDIGKDGWRFARNKVRSARCGYGDGFLDKVIRTRCGGYVGLDLFNLDAVTARLAAHWISQAKFGPRSDPYPQVGVPGRQALTIAATVTATGVSLRHLDEKGLVVAHIIGNPLAAPDRVYGIGAQAAGKHPGLTFTGDYYLVVSAFDTSDVTIERDSREVSKWYVFGVAIRDGVKVLQQLDSSGTFRYCGVRHVGDGDRANFTNCIVGTEAQSIQHAVRELRGPENLDRILLVARGVRTLRAQRNGIRIAALTPEIIDQLRALLPEPSKGTLTTLDTPENRRYLDRLAVAAQRDTFEGLAWMTCGGGCCTADLREI